MKLMKFYLDKINESQSVHVTVDYFPKTWKIMITVQWDTDYTLQRCFDSIDSANSFLMGFYYALPF